MYSLNVSSLKNNPTTALRRARDEMVVVMHRDAPSAAIIGLEDGVILNAPGVRLALATALFKDGGLSLARAAKLGQIDLAAFIAHLSRAGIPVVQLTEAETEADIETLDAWLASS